MTILLVLALWGWQVPPSVPPPPPPIPQSLMTMGPADNLSLQWVQYGPDMDTVQHYVYRVYVEGQKGGTQLVSIGCDGPMSTMVPDAPFHCRSQPPPLVKTPGLYRVTLTVAHSSDAKESLPSVSAPFNVRVPQPTFPVSVVMK